MIALEVQVKLASAAQHSRENHWGQAALSTLSVGRKEGAPYCDVAVLDNPRSTVALKFQKSPPLWER